MKRALVIDDEPQIRKLLRLSLSGKGYDVSEAASGFEGIQNARAIHPDIILLDLGLPDMDGAKVLEDLRSWSTVPVIILSVRNGEAGIVELLEAGADDYLTKPFSIDMLLARMNASVRRQRPDMREETCAIGPILVNFDERSVSVDGKEIKLTPTEYAILAFLARNAGKIVTHDHLIRELWGPLSDASSLRVHISSLRKKLEPDPSRPRFLTTEPGIGYRLRQEQ
jgi:two-component system, OmpR family, KDP operon response regulator KdpE